MNSKATSAGVPSFSLRVIALIFATVIPFFSVIPGSTQAAVTTSITPTTGTGNLGTTITQAGNSYNITGGTRPEGGQNLFHSFGNFSVGAGDIANFLNTPVNGNLPLTSNILGRVSGENISNIFGTIQTTGFGNANLFLMNPNGFLFGPNATLNVGGMVTFTTADYLRLSNGTNNGYFYADLAGPSLLTAAPVAAFGFLSPNAASIAIQGGTLEVPDGKTLSFIGGPRTFTTDTGVTVPAGVSMTGGSLSAPNGLIYMASVTSPGEIPAPTLSGAPLGSLELSSASDNAVIRIRSGEFVMDHAFLTASNSDESSPNAVSADVQGAMIMRNGSAISSQTSGSGVDGDISITSRTIDLLNGSQIVSNNSGTTSGGAISITATDAVTISGFDVEGTLTGVNTNLFNPLTGLPAVASGVFTANSSTGNGGQLSIKATTVTLDNGGTVATINTGDAPGTGGNIAIQAGTTSQLGTISVTDGGQIASYTGFDFSTFEPKGLGAGGNITVTSTGSVVLSGGSLDLFNPSSIVAGTFGSGKGGNISLSAPTVSLEQGGFINSTSAGQGAGGKIAISDVEWLSISQPSDLFGPSSITSSASAEGAGGAIEITAASVNLMELALIRTSSDGLATGPAGNLTVTVNNLSLKSGAGIESSGGIGNSGNITINATNGMTNEVLVSGLFSNDPTFQSHIKNEIAGAGQPSNKGINGGIEIHAKSVQIVDGGRVESVTGVAGGGDVFISAMEAMTISGGQNIALLTKSGELGLLTLSAPAITLSDHATVSSNTVSDRNAGEIRLNADTLTLSEGSIIRSDTQNLSGRGGLITITAGQSVTLNNGSSISASSTGPGNAGNISINAGQQFEMRNSSVKTESVQASGGNIDIQAVDRVRLVNSSISTSVLGGAGSGGNITIDPNVVVLQNSQVIAQAVQGAGGNITITTPLFLADQTSLVSASSQFGLNGTVTIQSPTSNLSGSLGTLTSKPSQAQSLLTQRCAALVNGQASSFVVAGREQLPADPGSWLSSPLALAGIDAERFGDGTLAEGTSNLEPQTSGLLANDTVSLRRLTPAGFLIANFADSGATGCHS